MGVFTVELLPDDDQNIEIEGDTWRRVGYDASIESFIGRFEVFLNDQNSAWHYYELEPGRDDRAQVFYGPITSKTKDPNNRKLIRELRVTAERCHNWINEQNNNKWKQLSAPIYEGKAVERTVHAE